VCPFPLCIHYRPSQVLGCLFSLGSSGGGLCQHVSHTTGIIPSADAPRVWDPFGLKHLVAGLFNSMVNPLEVFMDRDPMSGCAPMVRGRVTYRGPQEVIGVCRQECSHPQIAMFRISMVSYWGRRRLEGKMSEGVDLEKQGSVV